MKLSAAVVFLAATIHKNAAVEDSTHMVFPAPERSQQQQQQQQHKLQQSNNTDGASSLLPPMLDAGPDSIEPCAVGVTNCDETALVCDEGRGVRGAGFYSYLLNSTMGLLGVQYYVCACNRQSALSDGGKLSVRADSICKINEHRLPLPKDSNETCPDGAASDCLNYCNDVTFGGDSWKEANTFPKNGGGRGPVSALADSSTGCVCGWADTRIQGCTDGVVSGAHKPLGAVTLTAAAATLLWMVGSHGLLF